MDEVWMHLEKALMDSVSDTCRGRGLEKGTRKAKGLLLWNSSENIKEKHGRANYAPKRLGNQSSKKTITDELG